MVHPNLVVCRAKNLQELAKFYYYYTELGFRCKGFNDNLFNDEMTAFATEPISLEDKPKFRKLQLIK